MSEAKLQELGSRPAGPEQITRAREICGKSEALNAKLDQFLGTKPTRGQMVEFMNTLKTAGRQEEMEASILRICRSVGIEEPTGTDKLLALQIGLLQEQNDLLARSAGRPVQVAEQGSGSFFTPFVAGALLGTVLSK
ncbi:hypothetical protein [Trinickia mobilis]|uniref:hypothetical protein n=1 Tax=Trinickia mobilis TaxID=2816356 RepID=UPI001A906154|nr:hypothetical protein [Trinickia mobilis]